MNINNTTYRVYDQRSQQWLLEDATLLDIALSDDQELRNAMAHDQYAEEDDQILVWQECLVREGDYENDIMQDFYEGDIVAFKWSENEPEKIGVVRKSFTSHAQIEVGELEGEDGYIFEVVESFPWTELLSYEKIVVGNIFDESIQELIESSETMTEEGF